MATSTASVVIAPPDERVLLLDIKGLTGLICHNFSEKARKQIADDQSKSAKKPRGARDPDSEYEASFYHLSDGTYGFPCSGFKKAAIRASKMVDGISMTDARQMFFVLPDDRDTTGIDCVRISGTASKRTDVVRLKNGSADLRYRPELLNWSATLRITYDNGLISPDQIASLFYRAGYSVGVGDWRPERDGDFGRFTIVTDEQQEKEAA
tara:strand:+ start:4117 stop:4743 length:627 start_codon:yes stop_codon:yes gene_type:complete